MNMSDLSQEELVREYKKTGSEEVLKDLLERNRGNYLFWSCGYELQGVDKSDVLQEACLATVIAIKYFDTENGAKFTTYLRSCVIQRYNRIYAQQHSYKRGNGALARSWEELEEIHKEQYTEFDYTEAVVKEYLATLTGVHHSIATMLYEGWSKKQIAEKLNITPATVTYYIRQLQQITNKYFS